MAVGQVSETSTRYSDGTLSYTPRRLATGRKTAKAVVEDATGNTARRTRALRVR